MADAILRLAAVTIGAAQVGVAADAVLQALPLAGALALLPRRRGALCGVVEHAGRLVPVVDLAHWVDVGAAPDAAAAGARDGARVLLLRAGARRIGLRVDAVHGLAEVAASDLMRLHHDDDPDEVFHTVVKARQPEMVLSVLDVGRLAALAMAWHQDDAGDAAATDAPAAPVVPARAAVLYGLLQAGGTRLAAPVTSLAEVLPVPAVQHAGFGLAHCLWRGRHVPVLPADVLATGQAAAPALLAILEHDGLALGLPVDAALGMQPFAPDDAADGAAATDQDGLATVRYDTDGQPVLLLDPARLLARYPEAALSRQATRATAHATRPVNPTAHIVFEADGLASTPIDAIEQVVPLASTAPTGTMPWRGQAIRVRDLRPAGQGGAGQALIVRAGAGPGARHVACVVNHVLQLIPPRAGQLYRMGAVDFVSVGDGDGARQTSYRIQDLARFALP